MSKTIAVFGAGTGVGLATAKRFAREGFAVALAGRRQSTLDDVAARIGGQVRTFTVDITDHARLAEVVAEIGDIEVMVSSATGMDEVVARPVGLRADALRSQLELRLVAPVELTRLVLPGMLERGSGTLLYATGASAVMPVPMISNIGAAAAGLRNYVHTLHGEIADQGVQAAVLMVGGLVRGSEAQRQYAPDGGHAMLEPDDLGKRMWDLHTGRDQVELLVEPELSEGTGKTES